MTPDTNMVERVARALWDLDQSRIVSRAVYFTDVNAVMFGNEWSGKMVPWAHVVGPNVVASVAGEWREAARVAIAAGREPTREMAEHGARAAMFEPDSQESRQAATSCFRAMIDTALAEGAEG